MRAWLTLDVGGTEIKAALLSEDYCPLDNSRKYPSRSRESRSVFLEYLAAILEEGARQAAEGGYTLAGVGLAFPGPFDYARGVSRMQGIGKYDCLYGFPLGDYLRGLPFLQGLPLCFANDADLYALGEYWLGGGKDYSRALFACMGTGLGSGFVEKGRLVKSGPRVPQDGWLFREPFHGGTLDGWISAAGLRRLMEEAGGFSPDTGGKELAAAAAEGNRPALEIWAAFGQLLAEALPPYACRFGAEAVFLGGQIAKSAHLFTGPLEKELTKIGIRLRISEDSALRAMQALPLLLEKRIPDPYAI